MITGYFFFPYALIGSRRELVPYSGHIVLHTLKAQNIWEYIALIQFGIYLLNLL